MAPGYGIRRAGSSPWPILRPGPRSALSRELSWRPLGPEDNHELAALIARVEEVDNPPYRTSEQETAEYFLDPTYSDDELVTTLRRLERSGRSFKEPQRYKGLGEMDAHQLAETTMEPQHRTLRRITLGDEAQVMEAESVFELLMGSSVEPRRDFIVEGARDVDRERIDA